MMKDLVLLLSAPGMVIDDERVLAELDGAEKFRRRGYLSLVREGTGSLPEEFERWITSPSSTQIHPRTADGALVWVAVILRNDREGYNPPVLRRLERALRIDWQPYRSALRVAIVTCGPRRLPPNHLLFQDARVQPARHAPEPTLSSALQVLRQLMVEA